MKKAELIKLLHADYGDGLTTLMMACASLNPDLVRKILCAGLDVNRQDNQGNTALYYSIQYNDDYEPIENESKILKIIRLLNSYGADVNPPNNHCEPPLYRAVDLNFLNCTKELIALGANINCIYQDQETPLLCAIKQNYTEIIDFLLKSGADINFLSWLNRTALISVICEKYKEINGCYSITYHSSGYSTKRVQTDSDFERLLVVNRLIEYGVHLNLQDGDGNTALHYATMTHQFDIVKTLIRKGADMTIKNGEEKDFYDLLLLEGEKHTKSILLWLKKNKSNFVELKQINQDAAKFGI